MTKNILGNIGAWIGLIVGLVLSKFIDVNFILLMILGFVWGAVLFKEKKLKTIIGGRRGRIGLW